MKNNKPEHLTKEQSLVIDIETYNLVMEHQWKIDKKEKNLVGKLRKCTYCGRKYNICCICPPAEREWDEMLKEVSNRKRSNNF